jgi:hypothetical protein
VFTGRFLLGLWRLDSGVRGPHFRRRLRCLRHLDGVAFDALNSATRCWALCPIGEVSTGRPLLVASPSGAHVGRFLPDCPVAPRLPGFFAILNYQKDRWQCLPADSATSMQLRIREPIGSSLGESSIRARWLMVSPPRAVADLTAAPYSVDLPSTAMNRVLKATTESRRACISQVR